jgi:hypothetical protein
MRNNWQLLRRPQYYERKKSKHDFTYLVRFALSWVRPELLQDCPLQDILPPQAAQDTDNGTQSAAKVHRRKPHKTQTAERSPPQERGRPETQRRKR